MVRHEEKYLLNARQYSILRSRVASVLHPDSHYENGKYIVSSLYFDDEKQDALREKLDGRGRHTKYRIRTYDLSDERISLECKIKEGVMTEKTAALISRESLAALAAGVIDPLSGSDAERKLKAQMAAAGLKPGAVIKYVREAYTFEPLDVRITFDTRLDLLPAAASCLVSEAAAGFPALGREQYIMEVKYNDHLPAMIRRLCATSAQKISFSKYAMCKLARQ